MPDDLDKKAERIPTLVYYLDGVTYIPHYTMTGFAYPGIKKDGIPVQKDDLVKRGATQGAEMLYRSYGRKL